MKKLTKKYLLSTLALSTAFCGLLGVNALTTKADGEEDPFANFRIADAEVRADDPSGIRFVTEVSADQLAAAESFGTVVIPKALLQDGDVANLVIENTDAANIPTEAWLDEEQTAYAGVIVGGNEEDGFVSLPATFYDNVLVAKAYAVVDGEVVYSTNYVEASIAQVAADALNAGDTTPLLQDIVDYVLDDELAFSVTSVETEIGADPVVATLETKGLNAKVESSDKDVAYWADGKVRVGTKAGTAIITASIGDAVASIEVKVAERAYEYGVISDMKYGSDAFYHDSLTWGASIMQDPGFAYGGRMTDYGVAKELTDAEYEALLAAGYKGAKASKSVWSTREPIHSKATSSFGLHNGVAAAVNLGSQSFNKVISDIIDDASIDMNGAYVSVWVRSSVAVNYGFTYLSPMSEYGKYAGKHLGHSYQGTPSVMSASANQWVELKYDVNALRTMFAGNDIKGLGFQFVPRTQTGDFREIGETDGVDFNFEIYSIEIAYPSTLSGYTFTTATKVDVSALGIENFTQNHVVKSGATALVEGVDYTLANGAISNIAVGSYTIETTVSGDDVAQRTIVRNFVLSNQVTQVNNTNVVWAGWHPGGFAGENTTLAAKPDGYNGTKTDLSAVKATSTTTISSTYTAFRAGVDVSALTKNIATMADDQYLAIWMRVNTDGKAPNFSRARVSLIAGTNGNTYALVAVKDNIITSGQARTGAWVNLRLTKAELNVAGVESKTHLYFEFYEENDNTYTLEFYSVEVLTQSIKAESTNVIDLDPSKMVSAGWHGPATTSSAACQRQGYATMAPTAADGYIGTRTADWSLYCEGTDANCAFAFNISSFLANIDTLMDDNDYVSIWIKHHGTSWGIFSAKVHLKNANSRDGSHATAATTIVDDYRPSKTATEVPDKWIEIRLTKQQLKAAYTSEDKVWLMFEFNIGGGSRDCLTYIYDIAVVNVD